MIRSLSLPFALSFSRGVVDPASRCAFLSTRLASRAAHGTAQAARRNALFGGAALHPNGRSFGLIAPPPVSAFDKRASRSGVRADSGETGRPLFKTAKLSYWDTISQVREGRKRECGEPAFASPWPVLCPAECANAVTDGSNPHHRCDSVTDHRSRAALAEMHLQVRVDIPHRSRDVARDVHEGVASGEEQRVGQDLQRSLLRSRRVVMDLGGPTRTLNIGLQHKAVAKGSSKIWRSLQCRWRERPSRQGPGP